MRLPPAGLLPRAALCALRAAGAAVRWPPALGDLRRLSAGPAAPSPTTSGGSEAAFHAVADATLEQLEAALTAANLEEVGGRAYDLAVSQGVLTLQLGAAGTYVINKQAPNRQLWWSSPVSGPRRYALQAGRWANTRDGHDLVAALAAELQALTGQPLPALAALQGPGGGPA